MGSPVSGGEGEADLGGFDDLGGEEMDLGNDDKPFDDTPFDAGVEADEESSPEKYIQQLAGKLGQSLRKYTEDQGQPDFDLEKFAINSVLSATNSSEMDQKDQSDIISKVKSSKTDTTPPDEDKGKGDGNDLPDEEGDGADSEFDLDSVDMEESHNPNVNRKTVFQNAALGVGKNGMEENKYLTKENKKIIGDLIKKKLNEASPEIKPMVKPDVKPEVRPSRKSKPWRIAPTKTPDPQPKAIKEGDGEIKYISNSDFTDGDNSVSISFDVDGIRFVENFTNSGDASPEDPSVYVFNTEPLSNGKQYKVNVSFYGNPEEGLNLRGFTDGKVPTIEEV